MKRAEGLRDLSSEHHSALVLVKHLKQALAADAVERGWREAVVSFEAELEPHFQKEEQQLLPALEAAGEGAIVQRTLADHAELRELIRSPSTDAATLQRFAERLKAHIRFEERELFELAQQCLPGFALSD